MGRWFSGSLISVPPLQETIPVGGRIYHGGRILAWYTRLSSSGIFVKIASLSLYNPSCYQEVCFSRVSRSTPSTINKDKEEEAHRPYHVDRRPDRWILHGACRSSIFLHFYKSVLRLNSGANLLGRLLISHLTLVVDSRRQISDFKFRIFQNTNESHDCVITRSFEPIFLFLFIALPFSSSRTKELTKFCVIFLRVFLRVDKFMGKLVNSRVDSG